MRDANGRIFYGWWIVLSFFVLNVYWAGTLISGLTVFFTPVRHSFGWSAALLAFVFSMTNIATGLVAPLVGAWFDRAGPRGLMLGAALAGGAGLLAASRATSLAAFLLGWLVVCGGFGIWGAGTGLGAASLWFVRRRGLAMGLILAGVKAGGLLVPLWQLVVDAAGWRTAFVFAGVGLWLVGIPSSLILRHRPADLGLRPDGDTPTGDVGTDAETRGPNGRESPDAGLATALRTWQFWIVSLATALVMAGSTAAAVLMLPRLEEAHLASATAVAAVTVVTLLGAVARLGTGWLSDRAGATTLAAATCVLQTVGLLAFATAPERTALLVLFVIGFGLGSDNIRLLAAVILARYYGAAAFGRIQGILFVTLLPGGVLGPVIAGAFHDAGHGYGPAFVLFAFVTLAMALPLLALRPPPRRPAVPAGM